MAVVKHLRIHGVVQGVGFRYGLADEAQRLGLKGWVRNRSDGTVEAVVSGDEDAVQRLIDWSRRGPPAARVTRLDVSEGQGAFSHFEQRPTA
ncbi:MAG: acylphosphatase [Pseudomonadota bacterium]|jgi:acylphosphatase